MDKCRFHGLRLFLVVVDSYSKLPTNASKQWSGTYKELRKKSDKLKEAAKKLSINICRMIQIKEVAIISQLINNRLSTP
jgi:hypothetical protein